MSECPHCGNKAPIFYNAHAECEEKHNAGMVMVKRILYDAIVCNTDLEKAANAAFSFAQSHFVRRSEISACAADAWVNALDYYSSDNSLSKNEVDHLQLAANAYKIGRQALEERGVRGKIATVRRQMAVADKLKVIEDSKKIVLDALKAGRLPKYPHETPPLPFLFDAKQTLIWLFEGVRFLEDKTTRERVSRYDGIGYHGLYTGESHSRTIEHTCLEPVDSGLVALTLTQIYFAGDKKSFRVPYAKIVSLKAYRDAVEIVKDGAAAKRQVLQALDGHFAHQLIRELGKQGA